MAGDRSERQVEERRRQLRVDLLVRLHLPVAEVEERLPADEPPRRARAAAEVVGVRVALLRRIEDEPEERLPVVAREVRPIRRTHHAVPHPVGAGLELDGHECLARCRLVEAPPAPEDVVDHALADDLRQELVHDEPLVVPRGQPARLGEDRRRVAQVALGPHVVDRVVVEEQERAVQPGDHQVLVVSRVGDHGRVVGAPRQVLEQAAALDLQLEVIVRVVQLLLGDVPCAVDRVEIERRGAEVASVLGLGRLGQSRAGVERHVVVEELAEERRAGRVRRVVRVVRAQRQVDDQCLRPCGQRVGGVEQAAGLPELDQRGLDRRCLHRERRQLEDPAEVIAPFGPAARRRKAGRSECCRRVQRQGSRPRPHSAEEAPAADPAFGVTCHLWVPSCSSRGSATTSVTRSNRSAARRTTS